MSKIFREISERRKSLCHIINSSPISNKKVKGTLGFPLLHVTSTFFLTTEHLVDSLFNGILGMYL